MHFQYVPFIWPLFAAAAVTGMLAVYSIRRKEIRGAFLFGLCMFLTAWWAGCNVLEIAGTDLATILFWANLQYISYVFSPVLWLLMVFRFIERDRWVTRRNLLFLLVVPVITLLLIWKDPHGLIRQNIHLDRNGPFPVLAKKYGPWFWIFAGYSDLLNLISLFLLGLSLRRKSLLYREQVGALFIGLGLVFMQHSTYILGINPVSRYDLSPVVAGVSGLIIARCVFRYRLFDIVPVARENIIENMADGLIMLDAQNRIADLNPAAKAICGDSITPIGRPATVLFKEWLSLAKSGFDGGELPGELAIPIDGALKIFEVSSLELTDRRGRHTGLSIILHEVTEQRLTQAKLLTQQRALALSEERERLARDLHDNLGQVFGFINLQVQAIQRELANAGINTAGSRLERLVEVTRSAHGEMREYLRNAKNKAAGELEFIPAVKKEIEQYTRQTGIAVKLWIADESFIEGLAADVQTQLANITKEALNNIRKHAEAKQVLIEIKTAGQEVCAAIEDDGKGFDSRRDTKEPASGLGLNIMRERAREIGGELMIDSVPGKGTRILLRFPLNKHEDL